MEKLEQLLHYRQTSLIKLFLESVKNFPERPALWVDGCYFSYADLWESAYKLAKVLSQFSAERCMILAEKNFTAYSAIVATLLSGKTYVPLNPNNPDDINLNFFNAINSNFLIVDDSCVEKAKNILKKYHNSCTIIAPDQVRNSHYAIIKNIKQQSDYAYLLFTSGSTGVPKGISIKHSNILTYIKNIKIRCQPTEYDRFSQLAELTFDFSVHDIFLAWTVGACLYVISNYHLLHFDEFMQRHRLTFWASVPSSIGFLQQIKQIKPGSFDSLRYSIFCGEALTVALARKWQRAAPHSIIDNLYGPTEASVACTGFQWKEIESQANEQIVPIGLPFPEQKIKILNENLSDADVGEIGELCLSGPQVIETYWSGSSANQNHFFYSEDNHWYRTGDLVKWCNKVGLIYQGRVDDQFKIRGRCVRKMEIELALQKIAETNSVAIVPYQGLIAFISDAKLSIQEIQKIARKNLPDYMRPTQYIELPSLPRNNNGKINYCQLVDGLKNGFYRVLQPTE